MRYLSVCSGIEAATVAWHPLGWTPAAFSEIEAFPRAVLSHHYPDVPLHGDFTTIGGDEYGPIDLLVGGTPCQDYSVAGLRAGLDGERGNLTLEFSKLAYRKRTKWFTWENVPGVFSTNGGRDFGAILATFSGRHGLIFQPPEGGWRNGGIVVQANERSFGLAWRVLDAQYFGVPQRRRRVFVVGYLGDWRRAAAVLFERHSLSGDTPPRRQSRERIAPTISARPSGGGGLGTDFDLDGGLIAFGTKEFAQDAGEVSPPLRAMGSRKNHPNGGGQLAVAFTAKDYATGAYEQSDTADPLTTSADRSRAAPIAMSVREDQRTGAVYEMPYTSAIAGQGGKPGQGYQAARIGSAVRRLTPRECERLQGFPDDYTLIPLSRRNKKAEAKELRQFAERTYQDPDMFKWSADGPRYKALGNSMAVPVMRWIGERIAMVEASLQTQQEAA